MKMVAPMLLAPVAIALLTLGCDTGVGDVDDVGEPADVSQDIATPSDAGTASLDVSDGSDVRREDMPSDGGPAIDVAFADAASDAGANAGDSGSDAGDATARPDVSAPPDMSLPPTAIIEVTGGGNHTCAVRANGELWCWGANNARQLGQFTGGDQLTPVVVPGLVDVESVALGYEFSCAVAAGIPYCWAASSAGQTATGSVTALFVPTPVVANNFSRLARPRLGHWHNCAIDTSGALACAGANSRGELGVGTSDAQDHPALESTLLVSNVVQAALGDFHSCSLSSTDSVYCWGSNGWGELGVGRLGPGENPTPERVAISDVEELALGHQFTCARHTNGTVSCWGANGSGQLGAGDKSFSTTPQLVPGLTGVTQIAAGFRHACVRKSDGTMWCWGRNDAGQIGQGDVAEVLSPVPVSLPSDVATIGLGDGQACAALIDGDLYCWGENDRGQVGVGSNSNVLTPTRLAF